MGDGRRRRDRGRGAGAGDLHADAGFPTGLRRVRRPAQAGLRRQLTMAADRAHLAWPFFDAAHRSLAAAIDGVALPAAATHEDRSAVDERCPALVRALADGGLLRYCVPAAS